MDMAKMTDEQREFMMQFFQANMKREKADKVERFRHLNKFVKPGQILFCGSSLMEQFPIYEFLLDFDLPYTIYNRGVGGCTTVEMYETLDACVYELKPRHVFINIGTNDLNTPDYSKETLIANYRRILDGIISHLPGVKLHLLAYYPINEKITEGTPMNEVFKQRTNARIDEANEAVAELAAEIGAEYHDLNAGITDADGRLKAEYTIEGMHMYGDGYKPVLDALLPILRELD